MRALRFPGYRFDSTARLHQQAAVRAQAGSRLGAAAVRFRGPARQARGAPRHRSHRDAAQQLPGRRHAKRSTVSGSRRTDSSSACDAVEEASDWKERRGNLPSGRGPRDCRLHVHLRHELSDLPERDAPGGEFSSKSTARAGARVFTGAQRHRPGLQQRRSRRSSPRSSGVPLEHMRVVAADTDLCPVDLGAYSLAHHVHGRQRHARRVPRSCARKIARGGGPEVGGARRAHVLGRARSSTSRTPEHRVSRARGVSAGRGRHGPLGAVGSYNTPERGGEYRGGTIGASPAYCFTAHVAEVEVDVETGRIVCEQIWVAHDCGRALNPTARRGADGGLGVHGRRPRSSWSNTRRRSAGCTGARRCSTTDPDYPRHAGDPLADRREPRSRGALRREGGRRGAAALRHPGHRQRDLRRRRHSHAASCRSRRPRCWLRFAPSKRERRDRTRRSKPC